MYTKVCFKFIFKLHQLPETSRWLFAMCEAIQLSRHEDLKFLADRKIVTVLRLSVCRRLSVT